MASTSATSITLETLQSQIVPTVAPPPSTAQLHVLHAPIVKPCTPIHISLSKIWSRFRSVVWGSGRWGVVISMIAAILAWAALRFAAWTARKDYLEYCRQIESQKLEPDCMKALQHPLPPSPFISTRLIRRAVQSRWAYGSAMAIEEIDYHGNALAAIGAYLILTIQFYVVVVAGISYVARRTRRELCVKENSHTSLDLRNRDRVQDTVETAEYYYPLKENQNEMVCGALATAIDEGYLETLIHFLENGYDCNLCNYGGLFPLYVAAKAGKVAAMKALLKHGVSINMANRRNVTALHWAAKNSHTEAVKLLLEHGADTNVTTDIGVTALHRAAKNGDIEAVKLLLEYGADTGMTSDIGRTALDFACLGGNPEIIHLLRRCTPEVLRDSDI